MIFVMKFSKTVPLVFSLSLLNKNTRNLFHFCHVPIVINNEQAETQ